MMEYKTPQDKGEKVKYTGLLADKYPYRGIIHHNMVVRFIKQQCPKCKSTDTIIYQTRKPRPEGVFRVHQCRKCYFQFKTLEESEGHRKARLLAQERERERQDDERHKRRREAEKRAMEDL